MKRIIDVMCRCHLFDGIPEDKYKNVLNCLNAQLKTYAKDAVILHIGEQQGRPGVVVSGTLRLALYSEDGNLLTIQAERSIERPEGGRWLAQERPAGGYRRQLTLNDGLDVDAISASYAHGVLTLRIPVAEAAKPRKIAVQTVDAPVASGSGQERQTAVESGSGADTAVAAA